MFANHQRPRKIPVQHFLLMVIIAVAVSAAAAIGAHIFHKSAISTAHMLAHTSLHACGKC